MKLALTLFAALLLCPQFVSAENSVDLLAGDLGFSQMCKLNAPLSDCGNLFVFGKSDIGWDGHVAYFGFTDAVLNVTKNVGILAEFGFAPGSAIDIRPGVQFFAQKAPLAFFISTTVGFLPALNQQIVVNLNFKHELMQGLNLAYGIESLTGIDLSVGGFSFATQRLRLGLNFGHFTFGFGTNLRETTTSFAQNIGVYNLLTF